MPLIKHRSTTPRRKQGVVLREPKGTEIPVKINPIPVRDHDIKLPLQNYLNPGRTYSNRSAIKLPKDDTKKSRVSLKYLFLVRQNPFRVTVSEHPHDHIEHLEDMMDDDYKRCKIFPFPLEGDARKWLGQLFSNLLEEGQNQFGIYQIDDDTLSELEQRVDFVENSTLKDRYPIPYPDSFTRITMLLLAHDEAEQSLD
ncbi:hypothetical protein IGI04_014703 [Brassica rapa subsp. trilocularis]|uniref:Uncharacterized protein n=1 Tax=Brassica rapa subsp. trilocularis TaxID=1813537 RepID=A0ABQ7MMX5_BRACM|nr:hypothetical protein IGI04_014703 [Brassica rapa subsp. trilocularis]